MKKRAGEHGQRLLRVFVLDREALSLAVRGDRKMIARLDLAARGEAEVVTSPMTLVEAYDGRTTEQRWGWVLSRLQVVDFWQTPSCTATSTRSMPCSLSSRDSRGDRSPSSPRTSTTWRSWSRTRSSSRRCDPARGSPAPAKPHQPILIRTPRRIGAGPSPRGDRHRSTRTAPTVVLPRIGADQGKSGSAFDVNAVRLWPSAQVFGAHPATPSSLRHKPGSERSVVSAAFASSVPMTCQDAAWLVRYCDEILPVAGPAEEAPDPSGLLRRRSAV